MEEKRTKIRITKLGEGTILSGELEAKGTHYRAVAVKFPSDAYFGNLGTVTDGWLVISCMSARKAYLFQGKGVLVDSYIQEKLGGLDGDYPEFGDLIRTLLSRSNLPKGE